MVKNNNNNNNKKIFNENANKKRNEASSDNEHEPSNKSSHQQDATIPLSNPQRSDRSRTAGTTTAVDRRVNGLGGARCSTGSVLSGGGGRKVGLLGMLGATGMLGAAACLAG